jgi:hypothetical protein
MREALVLKIANLLESLEHLNLKPAAKADAIVVMLEAIDSIALQDLVEEYNFQEENSNV